MMEEIYRFIIGFDWYEIFSAVRLIFIVLIILLIIGIVFTWKEAWKFRPRYGYPKKKAIDVLHGSLINIEDDWKRIMERAESDSPQVLTIAIIDADKLLDDTLRMLGFTGEHVAERLEKLGKVKKLKTLDTLWQAHRIRNNLVHATGFRISSNQAHDILRAYEDFFKELKVL